MAKKATKVAPKAAPKATRAKGTDYRDLALLMLSYGFAEIEKRFKGGSATMIGIRKAAEHLVALNKDKAAELQAWIDDNAPSAPRGRTPAVAGDTRKYRAQALKDGSPFLRLPVHTAVKGKGAELDVTFNADGSILVKAAARHLKAA